MTSYVVGNKAFDNMQAAIDYARGIDICFVAIFVNDVFTSEHEV
jgi:hypothetical protein